MLYVNGMKKSQGGWSNDGWTLGANIFLLFEREIPLGEGSRNEARLCFLLSRRVPIRTLAFRADLRRLFFARVPHMTASLTGAF